MDGSDGQRFVPTIYVKIASGSSANSSLETQGPLVRKTASAQPQLSAENPSHTCHSKQKKNAIRPHPEKDCPAPLSAANTEFRKLRTQSKQSRAAKQRTEQQHLCDKHLRSVQLAS
ncbi:hypothetical protein CDAR_442061 [Caerostris darwini]|uniref:Uncharacterized protein n=1 Tax=Caerostris darwini TaxID=1538125 RepID=A0AAV4V1E9_9ARAC|nr:hypothetical protein CDAR_442061 [Caerostris darwini]